MLIFYHFPPVQPFFTNKDVIKRCLCVHFRSGVTNRAAFSLFDGGFEMRVLHNVFSSSNFHPVKPFFIDRYFITWTLPYFRF